MNNVCLSLIDNMGPRFFVQHQRLAGKGIIMVDAKGLLHMYLFGAYVDVSCQHKVWTGSRLLPSARLHIAAVCTYDGYHYPNLVRAEQKQFLRRNIVFMNTEWHTL